MAASSRGRLWLLVAVPVAAVVLVVALAVAVLNGGSAPEQPAAQAGRPGPAVAEVTTDGIAYADTLVVYNGRSHYGDEKVFRDFEAATGVRLRDQVPAGLYDVEGNWWALSTRLRVPVVSTERVPQGAVTSYESLADPRFRGRTCLRTSNNEYNQSLVADMIVKRGPEATEQLLRSWMANEPQVINSDGEMLAMIAGGGCDVGLANHYYLGRALKENPGFPVAPAWPDQRSAGAHANVSGAGVVAGSDAVPTAVALMEWLTSPPAQEQIISGSEFAANPAVAPPAHISTWADVRIDPIDGQHAGPTLEQAVAMMLRVGWT
jgi:iron(III) transport system substrate-binding protein